MIWLKTRYLIKSFNQFIANNREIIFFPSVIHHVSCGNYHLNKVLQNVYSNNYLHPVEDNNQGYIVAVTPDSG